MAALSDYLESGLLSHIFKNAAFTRPTEIAIALTSGVPVDSNTGKNIPELPSGINGLSTNYSRMSLGNPASVGNTVWNNIGTDDLTAFAVSGTSSSGNSINMFGFFHPLYLNRTVANAADPNSVSQSYMFKEYPSVTLYAPVAYQQSGVTSNPGYTVYQGNGFIKNASQIVFPTALRDWGWVSGVAIVDNSQYGSGNLLMYAQLANPRYVYTGDNIKFDTNALEISLN
jgi:hypothetical protein